VPSVGGDWYEGLMLSDSRMALVVGDVVGHGIPAAADMALIRGMISALLHSGVAASEVFSEVSGVLVKRKALLLATAALVIIDVADDTILFATAGHPPPLLRLPDGQVRLLDFANGPMIGVVTGQAHVACSVPFPPGAQVVMCTDGLIEQRRRPFDAGLDAAAALLSESERLAPDDVIDALLDTLVGATRPEDDIAVLVAERTG
jgi:serine phosphatase RsbU (regulator of sigma subunit)